MLKMSIHQFKCSFCENEVARFYSSLGTRVLEHPGDGWRYARKGEILATNGNFDFVLYDALGPRGEGSPIKTSRDYRVEKEGGVVGRPRKHDYRVLDHRIWELHFVLQEAELPAPVQKSRVQGLLQTMFPFLYVVDYDSLLQKQKLFSRLVKSTKNRDTAQIMEPTTQMLRLPHGEQVSRSRDPHYHREYCRTVRLTGMGVNRGCLLKTHKLGRCAKVQAVFLRDSSVVFTFPRRFVWYFSSNLDWDGIELAIPTSSCEMVVIVQSV